MKKIFVIGISLALLIALVAGSASADSRRAIVELTEDGAAWAVIDNQGNVYGAIAPSRGIFTQSSTDHWTWRSSLDYSGPLNLLVCNHKKCWIETRTLEVDLDYICSSGILEWIFGEGFTEKGCRGNGAIMLDDNNVGDYWWCYVYDRPATNWHMTISDSGHMSVECQFNGTMP